MDVKSLTLSLITENWSVFRVFRFFRGPKRIGLSLEGATSISADARNLRR
jgi:hypothetical protein